MGFFIESHLFYSHRYNLNLTYKKGFFVSICLTSHSLNYVYFITKTAFL
jgi:hypothetical protein